MKEKLTRQKTSSSSWFRGLIVLVIVKLFVNACTVGPDYVKPFVDVPSKYKEIPEGWKIAKPQDALNRGDWWKMFKDPTLDRLENLLSVANQNIMAAEAQYRQARAIVDQARAGYYPVVAGSASVTRQKQPVSPSTGALLSNQYAASFDATWEPDLWGSVRRSVESAEAGAEASAAELALTKLSVQASLAQFYFELRALDITQKQLDETVKAYEKILELTRCRYASGVASEADILQAKSLLESAKVQAIDNGILRAQYEHAIAVLTGQPSSSFAITPSVTEMSPPVIPITLPSDLLERRPDVAQAERQMAAANAQIGVAIAAYFPNLTFDASGGFGSSRFARWFTAPARFWSIGPQTTVPLLDGGLRDAQTEAARANYDQTVASYRQTVLAAFQDVEDNLASLRFLQTEGLTQKKAVETAKQSLKLIERQYAAGTMTLTDVLNAETSVFTAQKAAINIVGRQMTASVGLIKALGGGWKL